MGKREFLIIIAFVVVGAVAYQVTAPPPKPGERSFSLRQIFSNVRREMSSNNASATVNKSGTIKISPDITEIRVSAERGVPVTIEGEERDDIGYEMPVNSTGPDEAAARSYAEKSEIRQDDLGTVLGLSTYFPREGTQNAELTLHVPSRLAVRVENSGRIHVKDVSRLDLRNVAGEVTIANVASVTGNHRSGELTVTGAGKVELTLSSSRAKIRESQAVAITARNGECAITNGTGTVNLNVTNVELTVAGFTKGIISIGGEGGRAKLTGFAAPLSVDVRRMLVELDIDDGPTQPISVITTEEPIRLTLSPGAQIAIDAASTSNGDIRIEDFPWTPKTDERESRLAVTLGTGGARALLRNARGDIVINRRK